MRKKILLCALFLLVSIALPVHAASVIPPEVLTQITQVRNNLSYLAQDADLNGDVAALQRFLNAQGLLSQQPTGFFGPATMAALQRFQAAHGIPTTGVFGPATRAAVAALDNVQLLNQSNPDAFVASIFDVFGTMSNVSACRGGVSFNIFTGTPCPR